MDFEQLPTKTLDSGQVLVEIEPNIWVDLETYKPKPQPQEEQQTQG